ncbi:CusA/CzcA family heavy metal efflux RND transporter [Sandaracinobacter neustonicus]|uniref:CusA/CzcA family heavy metal efflux RND transporter n=1 Tax=Sandaracinobacter neustonicus TaxID=1715348 RepID=A0A501XPR4_9SPHN|nr:CusA/CzcA family heavy metal efflux RND transporter [Sandaracinobacter neustonicus]TPE62616.1 CusA/CzcA family heavy metal efflux RND transporter [Sandaracinobacter neustonicus]
MFERILGFSVQRRYLVVFVTLILAIYGAFQLARLPIDAVPDITNQQVQINSIAPALGPTEMERQVTYPIETAMAGIPGLESTRSISRNGFSQVTAIFADGTDIYFARQQVAERMAQARTSLPPGVDPVVGPVTTGLGEVLMWTVDYKNPGGKGATLATPGKPGWQPGGGYLTSEGLLLKTPAEQITYLRTVQDWIIRPQMRNVAGVAGIDSIGGYVKQYEVAPDVVRLADAGVSMTDLVAALERGNLAAGAGVVERAGEGLVVRADARVADSGDIADVVIATRNGAPVRVRDVASVTVGREVRTGAASSNGHEMVVGTALMLAGENSRTVAADSAVRLAEINRSLPPGITATPALDRSVLVDATIRTVAKNLAEGALLVIVILFLLLGNFRAAFITALVIPLSMLLAATGMVRAGVSGNLMSLGALDFGLIVDGAVIIVENCLTRLGNMQHRLGRMLNLEERLGAVKSAAVEMIRPTVFGQAIILLVYMPLLAFEGVEGKMFQPMALTVMMALAAAFVLSLTFVPAMVALLVTGKVEHKEVKAVEVARKGYAPALDFALARPWPVIGSAVALFAVSAMLFSTLGREFIPQLDEKNFALHAMRIPSTSVEQSQAMQLQVEKVVASFPEVELVFSKTGTAEVATDPMPGNVSDTFVMLKPRDEWPDSSKTKAELITEVEEKLELAMGNAYEFSQPIQMRFNELIAGVRSDVAIKLYGDDFAVMEPAAQQIASVLRSIPGAADVKVEQTEGLPALKVEFDRAAIASYGLQVGDVADVVQIAMGGREAGLVFEGDRRFDVVVRLDEQGRRDIDALSAIPVMLGNDPGLVGPDGKPVGARSVPLGQLVKFTVENGPNQVSRENGKRRIVIQANVRGRDLGGFVADAQAAMADTQVPAGSWIEWGGQYQNLQRAQARLSIVVPAVFAAIFALLYMALGSGRRAAMVFSAVPLALTGGILALALRGLPFSISAAVGFIALSGVAVLNGLVMMSSILKLLDEGREVEDAVREGAMSRLRPVMMTALVASLGFVPMAIATGTGAEVQRPIATVVIGGLITATFLTLMVLPALARLVLRRETAKTQYGPELVPAE